MTTPQQQLLHTQQDNQYKLSLQVADGVNWTTFQAQPYYNLPVEFTQISSLQSILQQYINKYYTINNNLFVHLHVQIPILIPFIQALFTSIRHQLSTLTPYFKEGTLESSAISTWQNAEQNGLQTITNRLESQLDVLKQLFTILPSLQAPDLIPESNHTYVPYFHSHTSPQILKSNTSSSLQHLLNQPFLYSPFSRSSISAQTTPVNATDSPIPQSFFDYIEQLLSEFKNFDSTFNTPNSNPNPKDATFPQYFTPTSLYQLSSTLNQIDTTSTMNDVSTSTPVTQISSSSKDGQPTNDYNLPFPSFSSLDHHINTIDPLVEAKLYKFLSNIPIFPAFQPLINQQKEQNVHNSTNFRRASTSSLQSDQFSQSTAIATPTNIPTLQKSTNSSHKSKKEQLKDSMSSTQQSSSHNSSGIQFNNPCTFSPYFNAKLTRNSKPTTSSTTTKISNSTLTDTTAPSHLTPIQNNLLHLLHNQPETTSFRSISSSSPSHDLERIFTNSSLYPTNPSTSSALQLLQLQKSIHQSQVQAQAPPYNQTSSLPQSQSFGPPLSTHQLFHANHTSITQFILHLLYTCYFSLSILSPDSPLSPDISAIVDLSTKQDKHSQFLPQTQHLQDEKYTAVRTRFYYILQLLPSITTRILYYIHHTRSFSQYLHSSLHHLTQSLSNHLKYITNVAIPTMASRLKYPWFITPPNSQSDEYALSSNPKAIQQHLSSLNCITEGSNMRAIRSVQSSSFAKTFGYLYQRNRSQIRSAMMTNTYSIVSNPSLLNIPGRPYNDLSNSTVTTRFITQFHNQVIQQINDVLDNTTTFTTTESLTQFQPHLSSPQSSLSLSDNISSTKLADSPSFPNSTTSKLPASVLNLKLLNSLHPTIKQLFIQMATYSLTGSIPTLTGSISTITGKEMIPSSKKGGTQWKQLQNALRQAATVLHQHQQKFASNGDISYPDKIFCGKNSTNPFWGLDVSLGQTDTLFLNAPPPASHLTQSQESPNLAPFSTPSLSNSTSFQHFPLQSLSETSNDLSQSSSHAHNVSSMTPQLLQTPLQFEQPLTTSYALPFDSMLWDDAPSSLFFDHDGNHIQLKSHPQNTPSNPHNASTIVLREQYQIFLAQNRLTPLPGQLNPFSLPSATHHFPDQNLPIKSSGLGHFTATSTMYSAVSQLTGSISSSMIPTLGDKKRIALTSLLCRNRDQILGPNIPPLLGLPALSSPQPYSFATSDLIKGSIAGKNFKDIYATIISSIISPQSSLSSTQPPLTLSIDENLFNNDSTLSPQQHPLQTPKSTISSPLLATPVDPIPINNPIQIQPITDQPTSLLATMDTHVPMPFIDQDLLLTQSPIEEVVNNLLIRALVVSKYNSTTPNQPNTNSLPGQKNYIGPLPTSSFYSINSFSGQDERCDHSSLDSIDTSLSYSSTSPINPLAPAPASNYLRLALGAKDKDKDNKDIKDGLSFVTSNGVIVQGLNNILTQSFMPNIALYAEPDPLEFDHNNSPIYDSLYHIVDNLCLKVNDLMKNNSTSLTNIGTIQEQSVQHISKHSVQIQNRAKFDQFSFHHNPIPQLSNFSTVIYPTCSFIDPTISAQNHFNSAQSESLYTHDKSQCLHHSAPQSIFSHVSEAGKLYSFLVDHFQSIIAISPHFQHLIEVLSPYPCQSGCVEDHSVHIASYLESTILHNIVPLFTSTISTMRIPESFPIITTTVDSTENMQTTHPFDSPIYLQDSIHEFYRDEFVTTSKRNLFDSGMYSQFNTPDNNNDDHIINIDEYNCDLEFLLNDEELAFLDADCNPVQVTFALPTHNNPLVDLHSLYNFSSQHPHSEIDFSTDPQTTGGKYKQHLLHSLPTTADESIHIKSTSHFQTPLPNSSTSPTSIKNKPITKRAKKGLPPRPLVYNYLAQMAARLALPHHRTEPIPISILSAPELQSKRHKALGIAPDYAQFGSFFPGFGGSAPFNPFSTLIYPGSTTSTGNAKRGLNSTTAQSDKFKDDRSQKDKAPSQPFLQINQINVQLGPNTTAKPPDPKAIALFQEYMSNYKAPSLMGSTQAAYEVVNFLPPTPDSPAYCFCQTQSLGEMVGCENEECPFEWFHFQCVGISTPPRGQWWCLHCINSVLKKSSKGSKITKKIQIMADSQERILHAALLAPRVSNKNCKISINTTAYYQFIPNATGELVPLHNDIKHNSHHGHGHGHQNILHMFQNIDKHAGNSMNDFD